ncbi:PKD domain-containing protein [Haloarcula sediminis]|uniref:PKD domain-containing protein n=1 Tax=Haloarcula sediminis TaxID=3111777 RepID=UPI002D7731A2|nr:PKD domain-containing protein [Haloarcula sp. CK38]
MRRGTLLLLAAVVLLATTGTALAADNTAPLADAGVDQTVPVNGTVYLDGNASVDPDGEITRVEWSIETPGGATTTPDCVGCRRTEFDATAVGQYTVTLTVTDDDGVSRSDTLYVTVTNESGPDVSLSGAGSTRTGTNATVAANVSNDDAPLQAITWLVNGSVAERDSLDGMSASRPFTHSFDSAGEVPVTAVVYDTLGQRGSATRRISVGNTGGGTSSGCFAIWCGSEADMQYSFDGEQTYVDTNGDGKITTYQDGQLVDIDPDASNVRELDGGGYKIDGGPEAVSRDKKEGVNEPIDGSYDSVDDKDGGSSSDDDDGGSSSSDDAGHNHIGGDSSDDDEDDDDDSGSNWVSIDDDDSSSSDNSGGISDADDDGSVIDDARDIISGGFDDDGGDDSGGIGGGGLGGGLF